jgi:hypothetical protein
MRRLLEDESLLDSPEMRLAELFRAASPYRVDRFRKRRVSVHLERASARSARQFWLRPVVAAALLVSGTAAAALGHRYAAPSFGILDLANARKPRAISAAPTTLRPTAALGATPNVVEAALQPAGEPALTAPERQASATHGKKSGTRLRASSGEDATHVLEAIQALRTERDPGRAQALLDSYLNMHPRGALSGDALALSIEAAAARHDPRAADYAQRYLAAYPNGKYRALATRALEISR